MAMIMKSIPEWLDNKPHVKVIRFLGTTPLCLNIYDVLFGVLGQLSDAYDMIMSPVNYKTWKKLVDFAPRYLRQVASKTKETVVILLDSVDQLSPSNNAYSMEWLPTLLPKNLKVIISTLPEEHGILSNLKKILPEEECYVEVPFLSEETGKLIVETYLKHKKRSLTPMQTNLLFDVFKQSPNPLFLKLLLDEARQWNSFTPTGDLELAPTVRIAIKKLFSNLENKFGQELVSHALGYITVGLSGLTEFEIEDVLSCDDKVLNAVYKYHDPPVEGIVRIPPVLWARIRYDIREYLVEKMSQGKSTLYWYHRQFIETANQMYTDNGKEAELHKNLVSVYLYENGFKGTITLVHRRNLTLKNADRQITPQPYKSTNKRKLACLPYHALRAGKALNKDIALRDIFCNFKFLCTKISGYSVSSLISDLSEFVSESEDAEVKLLLDFLSVSKDDLSIPLRFAVCILAYIKPESGHKYLEGLRTEARVYIESKTKPVLVPDFPCLAPRQCASSSFLTSLQGFSDILAQSTSSILLVKPEETDKDNDKKKNQNEEFKYSVLSTDTQELNQVTFKEKRLTEFVLNESNVFYGSESAFVCHDITENKQKKTMFTELIPKWKDTEAVQHLFSNADKTMAGLTFKASVILVDLESLKYVQKYCVNGRPVIIENVLLLNNGTQVIATGRICNSSQSDEPQGPANQCFVCVFEQDKEEPVQFLEIEQDLIHDQASMICNDNWLIVPVKSEQPVDVQTESGDGFHKQGKGQLLTLNLGNEMVPNIINTPSPVTKLVGHPVRPQLLALTCTGAVFTVKLSDKTTEADVRTLVLDVPVSDVLVDWDRNTAFLCSCGKIIVYRLTIDTTAGVIIAHAMEILKILPLDQQFITLSANREIKVWALQSLEKHFSQKELVLQLEIAETLSEQMNVTALHPTSDGSKLVTCHDNGYVKLWAIDSHMFLRKYNIDMSANIIHDLLDDIFVFHDSEKRKMKILNIDTGLEEVPIPDSIQNIIHSTVRKGKDTLYIISEPKKGKERIDVINIKLKKVSKTIHLQSGLIHEDIEVCLSANERFMVLKHRIPEAEYERIKAMWKTGGFGEQNHRYRFTAVDLSQGNGVLIPCYRQQSKIPTLGVYVQPYKGNIMLISSRR